jgi:L-fuconolactonase
MSNVCIDAHHHLWNYTPPGPSWMADGMDVLRRSFLVEDLREVATAAGVTGTIVVEQGRSLEETRWLSKIAAGDNLIRGVVGWVPLTSPDIASILEEVVSLPKLKAIRHPVQDEPDDAFILRKDFNSAISLLKDFKLGYDILILEKHLPQAIQFVDRHPNQIFILNHLAKPRIRDRVVSPWKENIVKLARRPNVYCKLSGMVTEADWETWTDDILSPYIDIALEAFGPKRLMFGSDWPVLLLASSYKRWIGTLRVAIAQLTTEEREWILFRTAIEAYGLNPAPEHE